MHHIIYLSRATGEPTPIELVTLLMQARVNNAQLGVTGALVYGDGHFMQVMEGEESVITALYERVAQDPRHQNIFKMADKAIEGRSFVEWSMAFREVAPQQFENLAGYISPSYLEEIAFSSNSADMLLLEQMRALVLLEE